MKILGMIPARGGSKGLPGKNVRPLCGKPLIQRAFECAVASGVVDRLVLSTDDPEIARLAESIGLEVPFMRPAQFATDEAPMIEVAVHALETLAAEGYVADALMLLQPTSPLRRPEHIRQAVELLPGNDAVCSVVAIPKDRCPHYLMKITGEGYLDFFMEDGPTYKRRQDVPQAYKREGTLYLATRQTILAGRTFYGPKTVPLLIDACDSVSIDTQEDWDAAERALLARAA